MRRTACFFLLALTVGLTVAHAQGVPGWTSVWDGVYTLEQAARGRVLYDANCSGCHRGDLGGANGRALVGTRFWQDWGEDTLDSLTSITRTTMPRGNAGSLPPAAYYDIVAYILARNDYPAGPVELTADRVERIRVIRKEGPGPVPNFALVTVIGCLERDGDGWKLDQSSEPTRTRNPDASTDAERERSATMPLGTHTFALMDVYSAGAGHEGHRMEVKGLLIRGATDRVNVTGMQQIGERCSR